MSGRTIIDRARAAAFAEVATTMDVHLQAMALCSDVSPEKLSGFRKCVRLLYAKWMMAVTCSGGENDPNVVARYEELAKENDK